MTENIWKNFFGIPNTEDVLIKKGKVFAHILVWASKKSAAFIMQTFQKIAEKDNNYKDNYIKFTSDSFNKYPTLFYEFLYLYHHLADRFAFEYLGVKGRDIFTNTLLSEIIAVIIENIVENETSITSDDNYRKFQKGQEIIHSINIRQDYYGQFKAMFLGQLKKEDDPLNNIVMAFAGIISKLLVDNEFDIVIMDFVYDTAQDNFLSMKLIVLLTGKI